MIDEILRTGKEYEIPDDLKPLLEKSLLKRLELKNKITKSDIKESIKYIKYTKDLQSYTKHFFDKNYYGFPLELMSGFNNFIYYVYAKKIIPKFKTSKKLFRSFEFFNEYDYQYISTPYVLHFFIILLKYKSKVFLMLYDTEVHNLHFALPISEDY
jgi:hypothetical protein